MIKRLISFSVDCIYILPVFYFFRWLGSERLIARDEGFYTIAARLLTEGHTAYTDFFFPQGTVSITFLAYFFKFYGPTWDTARFYAAFFSTATAACLWFYATRHFGRATGVFCAALFTTCTIIIVWLPTAQTYPIAAFFMLFACVLTCVATDRNSYILFIAAGITIGLAGLARFYLLLLLIPAIAVVSLSGNLQKRKAILFILGGFCIPMFVFLISGLTDPQAVWFNLVGYHLLRSDLSFLEAVPQKMKILGIVTGILPTAKFTVNQLPYLIWTAGILTLLRFLLLRSISPWHFFVAFMIAVSLFPTPTYVEYFCLVAPLIILAIGDDLSTLYKLKECPVRKVLLFSIPAVIFIVFYARSLRTDITRYTQSGSGVIGIYNQEKASIWNIEYTKAISQKINLVSKNQKPAFAFWPGYLLETIHTPLRGFENHFGIRIADKVTQYEQQRYNLGSAATLVEAIKQKSVPLVILDPVQTDQAVFTALKAAGYTLQEYQTYPHIYMYLP